MQDLNDVVVNYSSVGRAYPLIAVLEKVGTEAWHDQYEPSKEDLQSLNNGVVTPEFQKWLDHRKEVDAKVAPLLAQGAF